MIIFWTINTILFIGLLIFVWEIGFKMKFINWYWNVHQCEACGRYFRGSHCSTCSTERKLEQ